ncbi:MAG: PASTA domain-containing protein [Prevotella sp.]|nr:PASTA domain-containing protein [Prevotella sp.]
MAGKNFFGKFASMYVWGNVVAVLIVIALLCIGVKYGLDLYTHHGESIVVPNLVHMQYDDAEDKLNALGLTMVVTDTGYVKTLPPDCILEQSPVDGKRVKSDHVVYVKINSAGAPTLVLPDVIDNGSFRETSAMLASMGFKLGEPEYMPGERDWIYGIKVNGRAVKTGDRIPVDAKLVIQVGDGTRSAADSLGFNNDIEFEEVEVEEPEYEYEWVEVPVEEGENEGSSTQESAKEPASTTPAQ